MQMIQIYMYLCIIIILCYLFSIGDNKTYFATICCWISHSHSPCGIIIQVNNELC